MDDEVKTPGRKSLFSFLPCGHPKSDETSADGYTFCAVCAVQPKPTLAARMSQRDADRTLPSDTNNGGDDGRVGIGERQERELPDGDAEQRDEAAVPGVRTQKRDEPGGRRVLPLDAVPMVPVACGAEGDRPHVLSADCWCEPTVERVDENVRRVKYEDVPLVWACGCTTVNGKLRNPCNEHRDAEK